MKTSRPEQIQKFLLEKIPDHPKDVVVLAMREFGVTRPSVLAQMTKLMRKGDVLKTGQTSDVLYHLATAFNKNLKFKIKGGLREHEVWKEYLLPAFQHFQPNILDICEYGFGEMFNNAIDHSEGTEITVSTSLKKNDIIMTVRDDGIGIFRKIKNAFGLESERDSILQLAKGKLTTDKANHTGEGIFFTSRIMDEFYILSHDLDYFRDNREEDWFFESREAGFSGTCVSMTLSIHSKKLLKDVFTPFTTDDEDEGIPRFNKTHFLVALGKLGEDRYISRSQAKRILLGLDKFNEVMLDFKDVRTVGQGFVDEVFRVFQNKHPHIKIKYINANDDVTFMIQRGLPARGEGERSSSF